MNDPKRATRLVAKLITMIHGRPRQVLTKLTAADAAEFHDGLDAIAATEENHKAIDARATERCFGQGDLRKNYATGETDPAEAMAKIHAHGRPVIAQRTVEKGSDLGGVIRQGTLDPRMSKTIIDRFKQD